MQSSIDSPDLDITRYIATWSGSPVARFGGSAPWAITARAEALVRELLATLPVADYRFDAEVAVHDTAHVEQGAVLKGPLIIGPRCFIAAGAYLRGGNWLQAQCTIGPGSELKSSFVFAGSTLAHFNFVGDSILGQQVNLEAGSIVCNHRNEREDKEIRVRIGRGLRRTGVSKFGALIGDGCRIGANAVLAPGGLLVPRTIVPRASLLDQEEAQNSV